MPSCFSVVTEFVYGCTERRDRDICFEREFAAFVRTLRSMIQDPAIVPNDHECDLIFSTRAIELGTLPQEKYKALFVQYFRYDVLGQQKVFYREIQLFLKDLCETLVAEYRADSCIRLNLSAFDPEFVYQKSKDRVIDALMDCCLLLTRVDVLAEGQGAEIVQQYGEVSGYFLNRWHSQSFTSPVIDDIINLWSSYPHWERCVELSIVWRIVICCSVRLRVVVLILGFVFNRKRYLCMTGIANRHIRIYNL